MFHPAFATAAAVESNLNSRTATHSPTRSSSCITRYTSVHPSESTHPAAHFPRPGAGHAPALPYTRLNRSIKNSKTLRSRPNTHQDSTTRRRHSGKDPCAPSCWLSECGRVDPSGLSRAARGEKPSEL